MSGGRSESAPTPTPTPTSELASEPARPDYLAVCARIARHGLIAAECEQLTGGVPDLDGVAVCSSIDLVERAAYIQLGIRALAVGDGLADLVGAVADATFDADRFRVDLHDPSNRSGVSSSDVAVACADVIDFAPDLDDPQHRFLVVARADGLVFGEVLVRTDASYRRHDSKPWTTSSSLDARFARGLVNLVPEARSILDPCCGAGSIVLEAASLGLHAIGVDWKAAMAGMTRENVRYFGYDAVIEKADSRSVDHRVDAVVTDLPYGHAIESDERVARSILDRGAALAPVGVYVATVDITDWLTAAGYRDVATWTVLKRAGFTRHVHLARR